MQLSTNTVNNAAYKKRWEGRLQRCRWTTASAANQRHTKWARPPESSRLPAIRLSSHPPSLSLWSYSQRVCVSLSNTRGGHMGVNRNRPRRQSSAIHCWVRCGEIRWCTRRCVLISASDKTPSALNLYMRARGWLQKNFQPWSHRVTHTSYSPIFLAALARDPWIMWLDTVRVLAISQRLATHSVGHAAPLAMLCPGKVTGLQALLLLVCGVLNVSSGKCNF